MNDAIRLKVGDRWVGDGEPCYIVAEAGFNHNGDFERALRLVDEAAKAGVDAVKFQHFKAEKLYPKSAGVSDYIKSPKLIYDILHEMEMPDDWVPHLAAHCRARGVMFLSSPFDEESADLLEPHLPAFKVASYEMTHEPLLRHIARKGKPMIVSTGTATLAEVVRAVKDITQEGNDQIILLQCTSSYPAPPEAVNARALVTLRKATGLLTGLSDHSCDPIVAPMTAVALGACLIEKHFTTDKRLPGPDHWFALEQSGLAELVRQVREVEKVLGDGRKEVLPVEGELRSFARRSIFTICNVECGEPFTSENIAVLRCGKLKPGLEPRSYQEILGRRALRRIAAESAIQKGDYEPRDSSSPGDI